MDLVAVEGTKKYCKHGHNLAEVGVSSRGACKACAKIRAKEWALRNPDKYTKIRKECDKRKRILTEAQIKHKQEYKKSWYQKNKERIKQEQKAKYEHKRKIRILYNVNNAEHIKQYKKQYNIVNSERLAKYRKVSHAEYYKNNKEKVVANVSKYRARKRGAAVEIVYRQKVYNKSGWVCGICGDVVNPNILWPDPLSPTIDHIIPLSRGGEHSYNNTQLAHLYCNSSKCNKESFGSSGA